MCETNARSSAKSRSSRVVKRVHLMSHGQFNVACCITQSIIRLKSNADIGHPCLTLVFTPKLDSLFSHSVLEVAVEALDNKDDMLWNSICSEYVPQNFVVDAVESLPKIHVVNVQLPLPFSALFDNVVQSEDLVRSSSFF